MGGACSRAPLGAARTLSSTQFGGQSSQKWLARWTVSTDAVRYIGSDGNGPQCKVRHSKNPMHCSWLMTHSCWRQQQEQEQLVVHVRRLASKLSIGRHPAVVAELERQ